MAKHRYVSKSELAEVIQPKSGISVQHIVCHSIKGVARYVKRIRQVRSRQASERRTENNGQQLKIFDVRFNGLLGVIHSL